MLTYRVRPATEEDVEFLADVVVAATRAQGRVPDGFDERQWRTAFGASTLEQVRGEVPDCVTSVVEVDNERVGRVRITRTTNFIELSGIQLLPRVQRQGIGTAVIEQLQAQAAGAGLPLDLDVEKDNPGARRLYERLGFARVGENEEESRRANDDHDKGYEVEVGVAGGRAEADSDKRRRGDRADGAEGLEQA